MRPGRKPSGATLVDRTKGSPRAKQRVREVIRTLSGDQTIQAASEALGVVPSMFHKLRRRILQAMVEASEPRPPGPRVKPVDTEKLAEHYLALERRVQHLERELAKSRSREEMLRAGLGEKMR